MAASHTAVNHTAVHESADASVDLARPCRGSLVVVFLQDERQDEPVPISSMVVAMTRRLGLARADSVATLQASWAQLLGRDIASSTRIASLREGHLRIEVDDPAIADHLRWMASDLVAATNDICGGEVVQRVSFTVGRPGASR